jgi:hypothetical protein
MLYVPFWSATARSRGIDTVCVLVGGASDMYGRTNVIRLRAISCHISQTKLSPRLRDEEEGALFAVSCVECSLLRGAMYVQWWLQVWLRSPGHIEFVNSNAVASREVSMQKHYYVQVFMPATHNKEEEQEEEEERRKKKKKKIK